MAQRQKKTQPRQEMVVCDRFLIKTLTNMGGYECIYCNVYPSLNMVPSPKIIEKEDQRLQTSQALQSYKPLDGAFLTAASPGVVALFQVVWW